MPWVAIAAGLFLTARAFIIGQDSLFVILGIALIVAGVIALFVFRWMARRGI